MGTKNNSTKTTKPIEEKVDPKPKVFVSSDQKLKNLRAKGNPKMQLFPGKQAYAEGFGPESKLAKFLLTPASHKATGVVSLLLALSLVIPFGMLVFNKPATNETAIIKTTNTVKTSKIVVGSPVKWTTLVKRSDINSTNYLLKLPKSAENINITTTTPQEAENILSTPPKQQLSLEQRNKLAISNQPSQFFAASLLDSMSKYFLGSLDSVVELIVEPENEAVEVTEDAVVVDLTAEAVTPSDDGVVPAPAEPVVKSEPVAETPIETPVESNSEVSSSNIELPIDSNSELPATNSVQNDYIKVEYETPSPTITEQETDEGKIVTITDGQEDCEKLLETEDSLLSQATAGLLNGVKSFFEYFAKFFTANLEEAVSEVIQSVAETVAPLAEPEAVATESSVPESSAPAEESAPADEQNETSVVEDNLETTVEDISEEPVTETRVQTSTESPAQVVEESVETTQADETASPALAPIVDSARQAYEKCKQAQVPLVDVLAFTTIPEIYKVGEEDKIQIKWQNPDCEAIEDPQQAEACRDNGSISFQAYDTNNNNKLDYVEWTVPHLSTQIFEIIFISKAFHLDADKNILADIYDTVKTQDGEWVTINDGQYVRVTFEQILDDTKDNTIMQKQPTLIHQHKLKFILFIQMKMEISQTDHLLLHLKT